MYLLAEVFFYAGQRSSLPQVGYRPDAVFDNAGNYWGITFVRILQYKNYQEVKFVAEH